MIARATGDRIRASGGRGSGSGVQVGHVVTYCASPEGSLIYTAFTKKFQKRSKNGYPPFLTGKFNAPAN